MVVWTLQWVSDFHIKWKRLSALHIIMSHTESTNPVQWIFKMIQYSVVLFILSVLLLLECLDFFVEYWYKMLLGIAVRSPHAVVLFSCSVSLLTPSSSSVPSSFSPPHFASGNAFKSSEPGKEGSIYIGWTHYLFWSTPKPSLSLFCVSLSVVFVSLCSLWNFKIVKHHFLNLIVVLGGWPPPTDWEYFTWDEMEEKYLLHQYSSWQTETKTL